MGVSVFGSNSIICLDTPLFLIYLVSGIWILFLGFYFVLLKTMEFCKLSDLLLLNIYVLLDVYLICTS